MVRLILLLVLISNLAFADNQAQLLTKGTPAPYTGDLLPETTLQSLYNDSLEKTSLQKQLDLTNSNNALLQQDKTILLDQNTKLISQARDAKVTSDIEKGLWFFGGIILTGLCVKAAASLHP